REAKKKGDFELFRPHLEKIFSLAREVANHLGYDKHPYDPLLDIFEENLRDETVNALFSELVPGLKKVLSKVLSSGIYPQTHELENVKYNVDQMARANKDVLNLLGYPWSKGRLDVSAHPFSTNIGLKDVRITTRYEGFDFKRTLFSTIHEFGHALYELQIDERLALTPLAQGVSLGVHESQSRFWENVIGRNRAFVKLVYPILKSHLDFLERYDEESLFFYFNTVRPSLIRVDADEVTYNFHIYIRYQLERMLIAGEVKVSDLPEFWNDMMEELLGVRPSNHSEGVLQDIHWSQALIGYFPTYTIGNLLSAQIKSKIEEESRRTLSDILSAGRDGIEYLKSYLKEKIHKYGSTYPPDELIAKSFGESLSSKYFLKYLEDKYLTV
ncbi:MAG: carboxypeptidase M32, partial [Acidilobaceae archaeon]